jgi:CHAD domain-containing protein
MAATRLRSHLRTFSALLEPAWLDATRAELGWLSDAIGTVRDADGLLLTLQKTGQRLPGEDRAGLDSLLAIASRERKVVKAALAKVMASRRYLNLLDVLVAAAQAPPLTEVASEKASKVLRKVAKRPYKKLVNAVGALPASPGEADLHAIRIRAEQARYAAEAVAPVAGDAATPLIDALADIQAVLGCLQDATAAEAWLRTAAARRSATEALVAGHLLGVIRTQPRARALAGWPHAWRRASKRSLGAWMA